MTAVGLTPQEVVPSLRSYGIFSTNLQRPCTSISQTKTPCWAREGWAAWSSHAQTMWALELHSQSSGP